MDVNQEQHCIDRAQSGDKEAFTELFHLHYSFLYKYILKMTFDPLVTEEVIQDTMLKCYLHIQKYDNRSKFSSWLMTIATRTYIDYLRKKKRERWLFKKEVEQQRSSMHYHLQMNGKEYSDVLEEIRKLEPILRIPLLLKHYYGFSYEEIGVMLEVKAGTIKSRVHKGVTIIRKELAADEKRTEKRF
ncbi:MAG: RNA polymerase sigma factor SigY [Bacillus sp. (in: firmicutes)]